ncbi:NERD domain-containing protein [Microbacterium sp.]|uniref:protein kinase domain-containing protein n=1 Tax=Microbacterium sp. TaxID=51671 RepID=UPI0035C77E88
MGDPAQAQEAEALDKIRQLLPDDGIARAWANVTFTDNQGRLNEVDLLLLTRTGLFVVELKGWHGNITGDQQIWRLGSRAERNPRLLANDKAKRLRSVLSDLARTSNLPTSVVPYVDEAVVMHGRRSRLQLDRFGSESVWALDGFEVQGLAPDRAFSVLLAQPPRGEAIDLPRARQIDALMEAAGLMPRPRQRMIGQYPLDSGEPLGEGPGWQDFLVKHPDGVTKRRIRLFAYPKGADRDTRAAVDLRARREFRLTDGVVHPGIVGPLDLLTPEEGPALLFAYDPDELSLEEYLAQHSDDLTFEARERIVQELAELVRFAHGQRLTHRALSPVSVRVKNSGDGSVTVRIRDWDLARRPDSETSTATVVSRGITDLVGVVDPAALLYLAPETLRNATPASAQTLDVYGLGAVAFTVLTGRPPALNLPALESLIASDAAGLDPRSVMPEISDRLADVIARAAAFDEMHRTLDIADFQSAFEEARREIRDEPAAAQTDPLDASVGDIIGGRFEISRRRGAGSTGVALEVLDYEEGREGDILKLAKDDAAAARLRIEASVLDRLDHPRIVKRLDGPLTVGSRQGLLMTDAGSETLSDRIRLEGRATIEQLERYGADLFEAIAHLEQRGVFHRDIKPSNLAVKPDPGTRKPRLTLFDFSLAEEPLANVKSGSRPYLDPYLGVGARRQYDSAAERFAIAATLFELASGDPVWWPSGDAPAGATDAPVVQQSMFNAGVAEGLVAFFRTALSPDATTRHPSLDAMRAAWVTALAGATVDDGGAEANNAKADAATLDTPLSEAGLSARALSVVARVNATTVGELLGVPPMVINQIRGSGEQVRREITSRIRQWRSSLAHTTTTTEVPAGVGRRAVENFLSGISAKPGESPEERFKRLRRGGTLKTAADDVARWLRDLEGIATVDELAAKLLREYGSSIDDEDQRTKVATAVVQAILELDARYRDPKFVFQRAADRTRIVVAYAPEDGSGMSFDDAEAHLESLLHRAALVDTLLETNDIVAATRLREELRGDDEKPLRLSDARIAQLAIGLSAQGRMSSMGEAYRADMSPARAVELALRSAATREVAVVTIEQRVRARFPAVHSIPTRPALDAAVRAAMPYLEWRGELGKYAMRSTDATSVTATGSSTTWGRAAGDPAVAARLQASIRDRSALALVVSRRRPMSLATSMLAHGYGMRVVDLADAALDALRATAADKKIQWQVVLDADRAEAGTSARRNLQKLARLAIVPVWKGLLDSPQPTLFINAAVLARLGLVDLINSVMDMSTPRAAARWFILPRPLTGSTPDLDGVPMPYGADGWLELSVEAVVPPNSAANNSPAPAEPAPALTRKAGTS